MSVFEHSNHKWWKTFFSLFNRKSVCSRYQKVSSSCKWYWASIMKFITAQAKWIAANALMIRSDAIIDISWHTINFQSTSIHYLIVLYLTNLFMSLNNEMTWNLWFSWAVSDASFKANLISFFLWLVQTLSLMIWLSHNIKYETILLNNWCSTFIIIVSWILTNICDHAKFFTEYIQAKSFLIILFFLCYLCWFLVNACIQIDHVLSRFSHSWNDTW